MGLSGDMMHEVRARRMHCSKRLISKGDFIDHECCKYRCGRSLGYNCVKWKSKMTKNRDVRNRKTNGIAVGDQQDKDGRSGLLRPESRRTRTELRRG